jgi:hypothetical protein
MSPSKTISVNLISVNLERLAVRDSAAREVVRCGHDLLTLQRFQIG